MTDELRVEWARFLKTRTKAQLRDLEAAGFDLSDPTGDTVPYTRCLDTSPGIEADDNEVMNRTDRGNRVLTKQWSGLFVAKDAPGKGQAHMDYAVAVAARVIDAFSESRLPEVRMYCDCFRLAIGHASCGSQSDVAARHGVNRANVSFHVRSIQRSLKLPRNLVANSRQKVRSRK